MKWADLPIEKIEHTLMAVQDPCPHILEALRALVDARELRRLGVPREARIARALAAMRDRIHAMFIFGYAPDIYWRVDRRPAIRYIGTEKVEQLGEHGQPLMDRIAALLMKAEPRIILFHAEAFAKSPQTRHLDVTAFEQWLRERYDQPEGETLPSFWVRSE